MPLISGGCDLAIRIGDMDDLLNRKLTDMPLVILAAPFYVRTR